MLCSSMEIGRVTDEATPGLRRKPPPITDRRPLYQACATTGSPNLREAPLNERVTGVGSPFASNSFFNSSLRVRSFSASAPMSAFVRSEEHTSELQSLMRISYAVFCLKKK